MAWSEGDLSIEGPYRVLFDRTGVVERAVPATEDRVDSDEIQRRIVWFWHDVEHLVTALGRGQTWWAFGQLDVLRGVCLDLARIADGRGPRTRRALLEGRRVDRAWTA